MKLKEGLLYTFESHTAGVGIVVYECSCAAIIKNTPSLDQYFPYTRIGGIVFYQKRKTGIDIENPYYNLRLPLFVRDF